MQASGRLNDLPQASVPVRRWESAPALMVHAPALANVLNCAAAGAAACCCMCWYVAPGRSPLYPSLPAHLGCCSGTGRRLCKPPANRCKQCSSALPLCSDAQAPPGMLRMSGGVQNCPPFWNMSSGWQIDSNPANWGHARGGAAKGHILPPAAAALGGCAPRWALFQGKAWSPPVHRCTWQLPGEGL